MVQMAAAPVTDAAHGVFDPARLHFRVELAGQQARAKLSGSGVLSISEGLPGGGLFALPQRPPLSAAAGTGEGAPTAVRDVNPALAALPGRIFVRVGIARVGAGSPRGRRGAAGADMPHGRRSRRSGGSVGRRGAMVPTDHQHRGLLAATAIGGLRLTNHRACRRLPTLRGRLADHSAAQLAQLRPGASSRRSHLGVLAFQARWIVKEKRRRRPLGRSFGRARLTRRVQVNYSHIRTFRLAGRWPAGSGCDRPGWPPTGG